MQRPNTILTITDSLSLPRHNAPESVSYDRTWPRLLAKTLHTTVVNLAIGGGTIGELYRQTNYYEAIAPGVVIIQSGIVDCVPRALRQSESALINYFRLLRFLFFKVVGVQRLRRWRRINYTPPKRFAYFIDALCARYKDAKIIWIGILPPSAAYEARLPGVTKRIVQYNELLRERASAHGFELINASDMPREGIMSDHQHLNEVGHAWLAERLTESLTITS